jgi:hypothetical protein
MKIDSPMNNSNKNRPCTTVETIHPVYINEEMNMAITRVSDMNIPSSSARIPENNILMVSPSLVPLSATNHNKYNEDIPCT